MSSYICTVCSESLETSDETENMYPVALKPCGHVVHYACLRLRSVSTAAVFKCPVCKNARSIILARSKTPPFFRVRFQGIDASDITINQSTTGVVQFNEAMLDSLKEAKKKELEELKDELTKIDSKKEALRRTFLGMIDLMFDTDKMFDEVLAESPSLATEREFDFNPPPRATKRTARRNDPFPMPVDLSSIDEMLRALSTSDWSDLTKCKADLDRLRTQFRTHRQQPQ